MAAENTKRIERMISVRERQRDLKAVALGRAGRAHSLAVEALERARNELEEETRRVRGSVGSAATPEEISLSVDCVDSAGREERRKSNDESAAQKEVDAATAKLLEAHMKVKQMERLLSLREAQLERERNLREQRENDDLAATREVPR